ncbi:MAG TPA: WbqC family protein [Saprospiraceae bacterium]|nr:WbqC family protein [Saprospiraceae bacterium]
MKVFISQSNYIPWKGYFDAIQRADVFVLYDDMQYTKRDWRNRNQIKTPNGLQWLSIPVQVKGKYFQKINETEVADQEWPTDHWQCIVQNYRKAPFFPEYGPLFEALYRSATNKHLSQINYHFLKAIAGILGINTDFRWSSEFELRGDKSEKLLHICKDLQATHYISGPAAKDYLEEDIFRQNGIDVVWMDYSNYPEYPQLFGPFNHFVSMLDLLFNTGPAAASYLKFSR